MPKRLLIPILSFLFFLDYNNIYSQQYRGAVGARFGYGIGLSGVYIFNEAGGHGLEFLLRYGYHGLILNKPGANIQVLYEKHWEIGRKGSWTAYIGGGPALGAGKKSEAATLKYFALGISPIVGVDFTTQNLRIPLVLAFDYKPTLYGDFPISKQAKTELALSYYEIAFSVRIGFK
jgi:hypothetical protein